MKTEDKELLLKDLCARLPYGVKGSVENHTGTFVVKTVFNKGEYIDGYFKEFNRLRGYHVEEFKPYLRPMSSMTEEEIIEFNNIPSTKNYTIIENDLPWGVAHYKQIDWLNKKMFDYRGLIPKDLALSTDDFNPYKD